MLARLGIILGGLLLAALGIWLLLYHRTNGYWITTALVSLLGGVGLTVASGWIVRRLLERQIARLDAIFHDLFHRELLEQSHSRFLEGIWEGVKPRTVRFLQSVGPSGIPFSPLWQRKFSKLRRLADQDIPQLLSQSRQQ